MPNCATVMTAPQSAMQVRAASDVRLAGQVAPVIRTRMNVWHHPAMQTQTAQTLSARSGVTASKDSFRHLQLIAQVSYKDASCF